MHRCVCAVFMAKSSWGLMKSRSWCCEPTSGGSWCALVRVERTTRFHLNEDGSVTWIFIDDPSQWNAFKVAVTWWERGVCLTASEESFGFYFRESDAYCSAPGN